MFVIRARFEKTEEGAYISHLDLQRVMGRALKQSGLPVWYSKGFNPHIYMTFALPLPLTHNSYCDALDFKSEELPNMTWADKINDCLPHGIKITTVNLLSQKSSDIGYSRYELVCDDENVMLFESVIQKYNDCEKAEVTKKTKRSEKIVDLKEYQAIIHFHKNTAHLLLPAGDFTVSPSLYLEYFKTFEIMDTDEITVNRTEILNSKKETWY